MKLRNWLKRLRYAAINSVQSVSILPWSVRKYLVCKLGHTLSPQTYIAKRVHFTGSSLTTVGSVSLNVGSHIDASAPVLIEDGVRIACGAMLLTTTHEMGPPELRAAATIHKPIRIGKGCWIGARAMVLPGVSVAPGCMIAAGSVVASDTQPNGMYAGVPARRVKELSEGTTGPEVLQFAYLRAAH